MSALVPRSSMFPTLNTFFDDFFSRDLFDWNNKNFAAMGATLPSVNVKETDNEFRIELAAPGMKKDDFKIELDKDILTISSEKSREMEDKDENGAYTRKEFSYSSFSRSFSLPQQLVESDKIEASYKDGILHINVPKKEAARAKPIRNISIS